MRTFSIQTLGCRVNHYESQQIASLLRARGLVEAPASQADLRIIHTCSVTVQAASKSRQSVRRMVRLPLAGDCRAFNPIESDLPHDPLSGGEPVIDRSRPSRARVVVTGCWGASDPREAGTLPGVDAVLGHDRDVARELARLLNQWLGEDAASADTSAAAGPAPAPNPDRRQRGHRLPVLPAGIGSKGWMESPITPATSSEARARSTVKGKLEQDENSRDEFHEPRTIAPSGIAGFPDDDMRRPVGMTSLPLLAGRQGGYQRAFLKIQDGCDAHCTYCIIPRLRPRLWSKPIDEVVKEARQLVGAGHVELVLTGIFLGAYGHPTALRRRQPPAGSALSSLVDALCNEVEGLKRLRLSSLEPGDLSDQLIEALARHSQVVPHFHLPLQSGSQRLLRRMNRQYSPADYLRMIQRVRAAFDRPAITTDIIVGFPGETDEEFERTVDIVEQARFIHIHAFSYSPRPGTAAARWSRDFIRGPVVNQRIERLSALAREHSLRFRSGFIGEQLEILVERESARETGMNPLASLQHGRCERYFPVHFQAGGGDGRPLPAGTAVRLRVERVTSSHTFGKRIA